MAIPPFPPQDLAKLVLGYLAEEHLMTVYDEFLYASPYLDAMTNEYDRVIMKPLRNILAEYRAVKIYVETCKPFSLRKQLYLCSNLFDMVKFLVSIIDLNKLRTYDANRRENSSIIQDVSNNPPLCHVCKSFRLPTCDCRYKELDLIHSSKDNSSKATGTSKFVEATTLGDLPGNTTAKGRRNKSVGKGAKNVCSNLDQLNGRSSKSSTMPETQCSETLSYNDNCTPEELHSPIRATSVADSCKSAAIDDLVDVMSNGNQVVVCQNMSTGFQEFPTVSGEQNMSGIASSTSIVRQDHANVENISSQNTNADNISTKTAKKTKKVQTKKISKRSNVSNVKHVINNHEESSTGVLEPQNVEQKITILSDIRMDRDLAGCSYKMHPVLKNATSTPLMQTQDILINEMPAYEPNPVPVPACNYSNDEIMAMPTIILVPTSAPSHVPNDTSYVARSQESSATSKVACINPQVPTLGPLTIDITDSPVSSKVNNVVKNASVDLPNLDTEPYLVKIVDNIKMTTLPKDASHNPGTPQILPPIRKSSSTPRRTSHVRVLDFTTPRRILHETINEHVSNNNDSEANVADINKNAQIQSNNGQVSKAFENTLDLTADKNGEIINKSLKENSTKTIKKPTKLKNWDSDLRVHVGGNEINDFSKHSPHRMKKNKSSKRNTPKSNSETMSKCDGKSNKKSNHRKKVSPENIKKKRRKSYKDVALSAKVIEETVTKVVKPTINIIPADDWGSSSKNKDDAQSLQSKEPDVTDAERIELQNVIGAKLNISHLLETPYKQALYDIQMDTPRFLGTEILSSDSPVTDIKILNIPTPQFFDCPNLSSKRGQATPSSYSSRPTDYSSGGSYYKPDDQDYLPILETFEGTSKTEKQKTVKTKLTKSITDDKDKLCSVKSGRPVRQCTKNVSYYNSPCVKTKAPDIDDREETSSNCDKAEHSDAHKSIIGSDSIPKQDNKIKNHKIKKSDSFTTNNRSPAKKDLLKIKPRFTPKKVLPAKKHKRSLSQNTAKQQTKKRPVGKSTLLTSVVIAAPTKSRRKSSTPRKLHCTKTVNTESSTEKSAECDSRKMLNKTSASTLKTKTQESDIEQLPLQWSDDGSEESRLKRTPRNTSVSESDDISKIKDYIAKDLNESPRDQTVCDESLKTFDIESAKLIERDLCDTTPRVQETVSNKLEISEMSSKITGELSIEPESNSDTANNQQILIEEDEIELSVHECNELSCNYLSFEYDDYDSIPEREPVRLKDKFSMDVVLDDTVSVRLRATSFMLLFDHHEPEDLRSSDYRETENAVNTICNYDKLYTPLKESVKAHCYDIFDSTLTSLDTPLKSNISNSPGKTVNNQTVTEVVLEVEQILDESAEKKDNNLKRKRLQSETNSEDSVGDSKRVRKETEYDPASTLKNMDIESVLSKLHGP